MVLLAETGKTMRQKILDRGAGSLKSLNFDLVKQPRLRLVEFLTNVRKEMPAR
jgi:hypothetical protein